MGMVAKKELGLRIVLPAGPLSFSAATGAAIGGPIQGLIVEVSYHFDVLLFNDVAKLYL